MRKAGEKYNSIIAFGIASFSMWILLLVAGIIGPGEHCFIDGDLGSQYIPFIRNLARDIINHESVWYCRSVGLGINQSLLNAYYAINPFNILYIIFWNGDVNTITGLIVVIKTGLAALCFQIYLSKSQELSDVRSIFFAIAYALCSFNVAYNLSNIVWYDSFILLPVVCLMIDRIVKKGRFLGLTVSLAYLFIVQFYMGYMVGIFSVLYLIIALVCNMGKTDKKRICIIIGQYCVSVILAVMISALVWLPTAYFLLDKKAADVTQFGSLGTNIVDILNQFFFAEIHTYRGKLPYFYCGIVIFMMAILYFTIKDIRRKERIAWLSVLLLMLASCIFTALYAVWHGFDMPDGWGYRFGYIVTFMVCAMAARTSKYIDKVKAKLLCIEIIALSALYVAGIFVMRGRLGSARHNDVKGLIANILLMVVWCAIIVMYPRLKNKSITIQTGIITLLIAELITNGYMICDGTFSSVRGFFNQYDEKMDAALGEIREESQGVRINTLNEYAMNSGAYYGYDSVGYFSTAENYDVRMQLRNLGVYSSKALCYGYGMTPVTDMLLGVKYTLANRADIDSESYDIEKIENDRALAIGYVVDEGVVDCSITNGNAFENNNIVVGSMLGEDIHIFEPVTDNIEIQSNGMWIDSDENGNMVLGYDREEGMSVDDRSLCFAVADSTDDIIYAYAENYNSEDIKGAYILDGGYENGFGTLGKLSVSYIKAMISENGTKVLRILPTEQYNSETIRHLYFYRLNRQELDKAYEQLSGSQLSTDIYRDGYLKGTVDAKAEKGVLFLSIPYDKGWEVTLNGEKYSTIPLLDGAFTGIELPADGRYDIEMKYEAKGAKAGSIVSVVGIIAFVIIFIGMKGRKSSNE